MRGGYADADEPDWLRHGEYDDADGARDLLLWCFCFAERWPGAYVFLPLSFSLGYVDSALRATPGYFSVSRDEHAYGELGHGGRDSL